MRRQGFSLIEVMLVLAIAGVALAIGVPAYTAYMDRTRNLQASVHVADLARGIKAFERSNGRLPTSLAELAPAVVVPEDPWGRAYRYLDVRSNPVGMVRKDKSAAPINSDFDLYSVGKDGQTHLQLNQPAARDDVVRARDGAFIGLAEEFDP